MGAFSKRIKGLDLLRVIAIGTVVLSHYPHSFLEDRRQYFTFCLELMFLLSGYLLGFQLLIRVANNKPMNTKAFYISRCMKLFPPFLVILAIYFLFPSLSEVQGLAPLWKFLTLTLNYGYDAYTQAGFSHIWALCLEFHFCMVIPLVIFWLSKSQIKNVAYYFILAALLLGIINKVYAWSFHIKTLLPGSIDELVGMQRYIFYPTHMRLDGIIFGVSAATVHAFRPQWWKWCLDKSNLLFFISLPLVVLMSYVFGNNYNSLFSVALTYPIISFLLVPCLFVASDENSWMNRFEIPGIPWLAEISYSIYLTHQLAFAFIIPKLNAYGFEALHPVSIVLSLSWLILLSSLLYIFIEKPSLSLREKIVTNLNYKK